MSLWIPSVYHRSIGHSPIAGSPAHGARRVALAALLGSSCAVLGGLPRSAAAAAPHAKTTAEPPAKTTAEPPAKATAEPPAPAQTAAEPPAKARAKAAARPVTSQRTPSAADRARARQLVLEGDGLYERRELEQALARYAQAYRLVPVPTVGIEVVKTQMALGKLLEAQATAQEVAATPRGRAEPAVFEDARQRASQTGLRLSGMIPSLWLEVSPPGVKFEVELDGGTPLGPPPYALNPGAHQVRVRARGYQTRLLAINVREAERLNRRVELVPEPATGVVADVSPGATAPADVPAAAQAVAEPSSGSSAEGAAEAAAASERGSSLRSLGWVGLGVAAVAAGAGAYAGIRAFSTKPDCPNDTCNPGQRRELDDSLRMGTLANVSVGVAVVTGALGIWALASGGGDGSSESESSLSGLPVSVGLGKLNEIRVSGRF